MADIIRFLDSRMECPRGFGWFHLLSLAIIIALTLFLCLKYKNCSDKTYRRIVLVSWIVIILFEIYKEFNFCVGVNDDGQISASYQWYIFPYQFCSTPFYVLPFIAFLPDCAVRRGCITFLTTFILFAGITVLAYPDQVFTTTIGINIQTMIHHGSQIVLGIFTVVRFRDKFSWRRFFRGLLPGVLTFLVMVAVALILNEIMYAVIPEDATCNLFFISRHFRSSLPILCDIQDKIPYIVFLLTYLSGFSLASLITYAAEGGIISLTRKKRIQKSGA